MPDSSADKSEPGSEKAPPVCQACRFGDGKQRDCRLIIAGDLRELVAEGPCTIDRHMRSRVNVLLRRNYPLVIDQTDDIYQEAILRFLDPDLNFPGERIKRLNDLRRWLARFLRNQIVDHLRKQKLIARLRCGACTQFSLSSPQRCQLEFVVSPNGELAPNPWWGDRVKASSDPRRLEPACVDFEWRRPATFDIFEGDIAVNVKSASRRNEAVRVCFLALDRLAKSGDRGMREAAVISGHYFSKRTVLEIASRSKVSEKTVKRLLASGRIQLLRIMTQDFGLESPAELLS